MIKALLLILTVLLGFQVYANDSTFGVKLENGKKQIQITDNEEGPSVFHLATIDNPSISRKCIAISGKIKYEVVAAGSYLEMWVTLEDGGKFFSRTLSPKGLNRKIEGTSDWREFIVPFSLEGAKSLPKKIVFNLVLQGKGKVEIDKVILIQSDSMSELLKPQGAWWSPRQAGMIGGIMGGLVGLIGAFIGIMCGLGKGKQLVLLIMFLTTLIGICLIPIGIFAIFNAQPYHVYYPLLLLGSIMFLVFGGNLFVVKKRFQQMELKKMESMDS